MSECKTVLQSITDSANLGIEIKSVLVDGFHLADPGLLLELEKITKYRMASRAAESEGELRKTEATASAIVARTQVHDKS